MCGRGHTGALRLHEAEKFSSDQPELWIPMGRNFVLKQEAANNSDRNQEARTRIQTLSTQKN